ncbi:calcineurin B-like protein 4 isoform X1 [Primulina huaijiensis]|uniref:calcineurin B-like protein 4 isoform X1 n=1 Tax=Primulina huaijiensis TaxID=1492673 RepID=UPI003CC75238
MGCVCMKQRQAFEDPSILASQTRCMVLNKVTVEEVKSLDELFRKLSSSIVDDGFINREEFQLGLFRNNEKRSLLAQRMFDLFDSKHDGVIDFGEFVRSLSIFHPDTPQEEKVIFAFKIHDIGNTSFIQKEGVKKMIAEFLAESSLILSDDIIEAIIDKTFEEADSERDGKIDIEEWKDFVARKPSLLENMMTVPYLKDLTTAFPSFVLRSEKEEEIVD